MIELVITERCMACNDCVAICPTNVFDPGQAGGPPVIARQADCQTCFMCELYCRADALFVHPDADKPVAVDEPAIVASGLLGEFRRHHGWHEWEGDPRYPNDHWRMEHVFLRARDLAVTVPAARPA